MKKTISTILLVTAITTMTCLIGGCETTTAYYYPAYPGYYVAPAAPDYYYTHISYPVHYYAYSSHLYPDYYMVSPVYYDQDYVLVAD